MDMFCIDHDVQDCVCLTKEGRKALASGQYEVYVQNVGYMKKSRLKKIDLFESNPRAEELWDSAEPVINKILLLLR